MKIFSIKTAKINIVINFRLVLSTLIFVSQLAPVLAQSPWGKAKQSNTQYQSQKVVYDVTANSIVELAHVIDRVSSLNNITGSDPFESSIIVVLHGPEVRFFSQENYPKYKMLMDRAQSLTVGTTIKFKMGQLTAKYYGYEPENLLGFIQLVPLGDAEIIRLQVEEKYAYMR